ncbi:hypothetical protein EW145_g5443 [Phellinidium pouzarii]|uniref:Peptidase A1 domain-containing protein n=1 Tax=Phellinidium pouzarii TaxID=167371 RepID=A0A4S4L1B0_9AGAM|nr:hypothetical protein EW145_g5443 [Phellinidium pouzarii]
MSTNAESDGLKEYEELMSGDITSTPSKTRFVSSNYKRQSVDEAIGEDVDDYTCGGVDFPTFVKLAFNVSQDEYTDRVKEIEDWAVHKENAYRAQQDDLVNAPHEADMYNPIANMGNMVLKRAELEHNIKNKIKLLINHDKVIKGGFAKRKPDLLLVPEHVQQGLSEANTINEEETTAGEGIADEPAPQASRSVHAENGFEIISEENIGASEGSLTEGGFDATTEEDTTTNEDAVTEGGFEVITRKAEEFTTASNHSEGGADATVGKAEGSFASISTAKDDAFETPNTVENEAPNKKGPKDVAIDYRHVLLLFEIKTGKMGTTEKRGNAKGKGKRLSEDDVDDRPSKIRSSTTATGSRERVKLVPDSISLEAKAVTKVNSTMTSSWARGHTSQDVSKAGPSSTSGYDQKVPGTSTHMRTEGDGHKELVIHSGVGKGVASSSKVCVKTIPTLKELKIQLASYATEVLSIRGDRSFTFGVRMKGSKITLCFYHRSAIIEADEFDVIENPVYFALLLTMFHRDLPLLGFNKDMGYCNPFDFDDKTRITPGATLTTVLGNTLSEDKQLDLTQIVMGEKLASAYCLIGRGTSVISAKVEGYKYELAVKFSWQIKSREGEDKYILEARKHDPKHIPEIFGKATIEDNTPIRELGGLCKRIGNVSQYEEREFRILVMRQNTPIYRIDSYDKFWKVIIQIAICVHKIYALGKILHRDISITNIAFYEDDEGNIIGILLDFDLASLPHQGHDSRHRTGTAPLMAREVLNAAEKAYTHGVHHELESLLYIIVWHGMGYKGYTLPKGTEDTLVMWRKGTWENILQHKKTFIQDQSEASKIISKIRDRKLANHCNPILNCYTKAYLAKLAVQVELNDLRDAKVAEMESEGLEPVWEEGKVASERAVSFAEWMKAANVQLDESDKVKGCECCAQLVQPQSFEDKSMARLEATRIAVDGNKSNDPLDLILVGGKLDYCLSIGRGTSTSVTTDSATVQIEENEQPLAMRFIWQLKYLEEEAQWTKFIHNTKVFGKATTKDNIPVEKPRQATRMEPLCDERQLRTIGMKQYASIYYLTVYDKLWIVLVTCMLKLYSKGATLHPNLNFKNIASYEDEKREIVDCGVLLDFDLASIPLLKRSSRFIFDQKEKFMLKRDVAESILCKVRDRDLAVRCWLIHFTQEELLLDELSDMHDKGLELDMKKSEVVAEHAISFAEWMKTAKVELKSSDKVERCSADVWVLTDNCSTCASSKANSEKLTYYPSGDLKAAADAQLLYGDSRTRTYAYGIVGSDRVGVAGLILENQYFAAINDTNTSVLDTGSAGIFGFGFPVNSILWNELYTIAVLKSLTAQTERHGFSEEFSSSFPRILQTLFSTIIHNLAVNGNLQSTPETSSTVKGTSILSSFARYGPLIPRLVLADEFEIPDSPRLPSPQFTITVERTTPSLGGNVGELTLGGLPSDVSNASLAWAPVRLYTSAQNGVIIPEAEGEIYPYAWDVPLGGVYFDGFRLADSALGDVALAGVGRSALVDTGNSLIRGPADVVAGILALVLNETSDVSIPKSAHAADEYIANFDAYAYMYPCAEPHTLEFEFSGVRFAVDALDFGRQAFSDNADWCLPNLAPTDAPEIGGYLYSWSLGDPFLKGVLSSFYYGNITHPSMDPPRIGFLSTIPNDTAIRLAAAVHAGEDMGGFPVVVSFQYLRIQSNGWIETTIAAPTGTFSEIASTTDAHGVVRVSETPLAIEPSSSDIPLLDASLSLRSIKSDYSSGAGERIIGIHSSLVLGIVLGVAWVLVRQTT